MASSLTTIILCLGGRHNRCPSTSPCRTLHSHPFHIYHQTQLCANGTHGTCHRSSICRGGFIANPFNDPNIRAEYYLNDIEDGGGVGYQLFRNEDPNIQEGRYTPEQRDEFFRRVFPFWQPQETFRVPQIPPPPEPTPTLQPTRSVVEPAMQMIVPDTPPNSPPMRGRGSVPDTDPRLHAEFRRHLDRLSESQPSLHAQYRRIDPVSEPQPWQRRRSLRALRSVVEPAMRMIVPDTPSLATIHEHGRRVNDELDMPSELGIQRRSANVSDSGWSFIDRMRRRRMPAIIVSPTMNIDWYFENFDKLCENLGSTRKQHLTRISALPRNRVVTVEVEKYKTYEARLDSFHTPKLWKSWSAMPSLLAKAGFFYMGREDFVQCYACDLKLERWGPLDFPLLEHMKHATRYCTHLVEQTIGLCPDDFCHDDKVKMYPALFPTEFHEKIPTLPNVWRTYKGPRDAAYIHEVNRIKSFPKFWTAEGLPCPKKMAAAGWSYLDTKATQCFYCCQIVNDWTSDMDPMKTHQRYYPQCFMSFVGHVGVRPIPEDYEGDKTCFYCAENEANIVSLDCEHLIGCAPCTSKFKNCPKCKVAMNSVMRIFM